VSVFVFATLLVACFALNCKPKLGGKQFDLSGLCHDATTADYVARDEDQNTYNFNICGPVTDGGSMQECTDASVCQKTPANVRINAGRTESQKFKLISDKNPGKGIIVTYGEGDVCSAGDVRETDIYIYCDKKVSDPVIKPVDEEDHCSYVIKMESKYGCPAGDAGETFAMVVLIILAVAIVLYFGLGAVYKWKVKEASTFSEFIIHGEFWLALPLLIKDGCQFIFHGCKKGDYVSV